MIFKKILILTCTLLFLIFMITSCDSCPAGSDDSDNVPPVVNHDFLDSEVDTIVNRQPELSIPIYDPKPSSGIDESSIVLIIDDNTLDHEWNSLDQAVYYSFESGDTLDLGLHELSLKVSDKANNCTEAYGVFFIGEVDHDGPPFFELP